MARSKSFRTQSLLVAAAAIGFSAPAFADLTININPAAPSTFPNWPNSAAYGNAPIIFTGTGNGTNGSPNNNTVGETISDLIVEGETFTPTTNTTLGGISFLISGAPDTTPIPVVVNLFQLSSAVSPTSQTYTLSNDEVGNELLNNGNGYTFNYSGGAEALMEFDFSNGPTADDQIPLIAGTTYAFEFWNEDQTGETFFIARGSGAQTYTGGQAYRDNSGEGQEDHSSNFRANIVGPSSPRNLGFAVYPAPTATNPNGVWLPTGGGSWNSTANWSNNVIPNGTSASAQFTSATAASTVTLDGTFTVGSLLISDSNSYTITPGSGGNLVFDNGGETATASLTNTGGSHTITANLELTSNLTITDSAAADKMTITGNIIDNPNGGGGVTFSGPGTVVLSGTNTYQGGGAEITGGGDVQDASAGAISSATSMYVNSGTWDLGGFNASITTLYGNGTVDNREGGSSLLTMTGTANSTFSGVIKNTAGSVGLNYAGTGTLMLTGANTYSGPTEVNGGTIIISNAGSLPAASAVTDNSLLVLNANSTLASITGSGTLSIGATSTVTAQLASPNGLATKGGNVESVGSLVIGSGSTLDITNNTLNVNFGSGADPASTIRSELISGFNASGTKWTGTGIVSSLAATNPAAFAVGYADGGNPKDVANTGVATGTVEIKYTVAGDTNLSGAVDLSDLVIIASDFGMSGADWAEGDVNYDGNVDLSDLVIVASNFGSSLVSGAPADFSGSFAADWNLALAEAHSADTTVPEPGTIGLGIAAATGLLIRRRARSNA